MRVSPTTHMDESGHARTRVLSCLLTRHVTHISTACRGARERETEKMTSQFKIRRDEIARKGGGGGGGEKKGGGKGGGGEREKEEEH